MSTTSKVAGGKFNRRISKPTDATPPRIMAFARATWDCVAVAIKQVIRASSEIRASSVCTIYYTRACAVVCTSVHDLARRRGSTVEIFMGPLQRGVARQRGDREIMEVEGKRRRKRGGVSGCEKRNEREGHPEEAAPCVSCSRGQPSSVKC